jgi:tripartite-type tricarboxylate transporter receptor subunit TctC
MTDRREVLKSALALPLALGGFPLWTTSSRADEGYPSRTVTIVVPFPPGGTADFAGRPIAAFLTQKLARSFVVENRGGAGGGVGHAVVARSEADGYTLLIALPSLAVIPEANRLQHRPVNYEMDQFVPIAQVFADPPLLTVKKDARWKNLEELLDEVRKNPGKIPYGTSGKFGTVHLAMEMFLHAAGLKMLHVPYQGGAPAFNALLSDQVPVIPTLESIGKGHFETGAIRALAQWGTQRLANFSNVPTFQEAGYKDVIYILWAGMFTPRGTPENVQRVLRDAMREFMHNPEILQRFRTAGSNPGYLDGPEFAKFLEGDSARLVRVTRQVNLS